MSLKMYGWSRLISVNLTFCRLLMNIILILKFRKHCENSFGPFSSDFTRSLTSLLEKTLNCTDVIRRKSLHGRVVSTCFSGTRWTVWRNLDIVKKSYPLFKTSHEMINIITCSPENKIETRLVLNYFSVGRIIISDCTRLRYANRIKISFVENLWALETKWQRLFAEIVNVIGLLFSRQQNHWKETKQKSAGKTVKFRKLTLPLNTQSWIV